MKQPFPFFRSESKKVRKIGEQPKENLIDKIITIGDSIIINDIRTDEEIVDGTVTLVDVTREGEGIIKYQLDSGYIIALIKG
jgi:hypothetical protein